MELPIDSLLPEIEEKIRSGSNLVIVAPPGAGKTTRVPLALLKSQMFSPSQKIVLLQPRRIAVRSIARRIADELGSAVGGRVGYQVRFENKTDKNTELRILTEGILTRELIMNGDLKDTKLVILDEFHERSSHSDLAIALLRELQETVRPDLQIIAMSATLEADPIRVFMGDAPVLVSEGRPYPVTISYANHSLHFAGGDALVDAVMDSVRRVLQENSSGHVLIFLPGVREIQFTVERLRKGLSDRFKVLPLHGSLRDEEQQEIFAITDQRKIICATNIAETSLTIEGVTCVIDSGLQKSLKYNSETGVSSLEMSKISRSSSEQRAGRAGRTRPGHCYRLWTQMDQGTLPLAVEPELNRMDLASVVLGLFVWGTPDPLSFGWFQKPPENQIKSALEKLELWGAVHKGRLTELGRKMAQLPVAPRLARLLIGAAENGVLGWAALASALLESREPESLRNLVASGLESDILARILTLKRSQAGQIFRAAEQAAGYLSSKSLDLRTDSLTPELEERLLKSIFVAFADQLARRRTKGSGRARMVGGIGVELTRESEVLTSEFFVCLDLQDSNRKSGGDALVRIASRVELRWIKECFPEQLDTRTHVTWFEASQRFVSERAVYFHDLALEEPRVFEATADDVHSALSQKLFEGREQFFFSDPEIETLLAQVRFLNELTPNPPGAELLSDVFWQSVCGDIAYGHSGVMSILSSPWQKLIKGRINSDALSKIEREAPTKIEVPSGSRYKIDYSSPSQPKLSVRLQEIFGWTATPRIGFGQKPLLLELLAPNYRPVQTTADLASFWATTYSEVKRELKSKYPRHSWPENPLTARAESKGGVRR